MTPQDQMEALGGGGGWTQPPQWNPAPAMPNVLQKPPAPAPKAGIGGEGWNEDFDQAWANRMMKQYGVSMEDLRDEGTRRWLNRQQRERQSTPAAPQTGGPEPNPNTPPTQPVQPGPVVNPGGWIPGQSGPYGGYNPGGGNPGWARPGDSESGGARVEPSGAQPPRPSESPGFFRGVWSHPAAQATARFQAGALRRNTDPV